MNIAQTGLWLAVVLVLSSCGPQPRVETEAGRFERLFKKGSAYLAKNNHRMALVSLEKAQKLRPDHVELLSQLGIAYDKAGQTGPALLVWQRAHELAPKDGAINHNLGVAMMRQGMLDEAEAAFMEALGDEMFSDKGETHYNLALIQKRRGLLRGMERGLKRVLEIVPDHMAARWLLADYYRKMRRPDLEEKHLRNILAFDPESVSTLERLADLLMETGRMGKAAPLLKRIQGIAPDSKAAARAKVKQGRVPGMK